MTVLIEEINKQKRLLIIDVCLKYVSKIENSFYREFMEDQFAIFSDDFYKGKDNIIFHTLISNIEFIMEDSIDDREILLKRILTKIINVLSNGFALTPNQIKDIGINIEKFHDTE